MAVKSKLSSLSVPFILASVTPPFVSGAGQGS